MTITHRSEDKYAFLFTGPTTNCFLKDLENVFQTLTEYYNYSPGNITVVLGSTPSVMPSFPGASIITIASAADLNTAMTDFAATASGPAPGLPGLWKTALLYFTGGGIHDASGSKLVIDGGSGTNNVNPSWLTSRLNVFGSCHVNVVMQQSYAGGFISALTGSTLTQWSFTSACSETQESYGNNTEGGFFTLGWIKGLKLETLPAGTPDAGKYADQLGSISGSTDRIVSLEEAKEFGKQVHDLMGFGSFSVPGYNGSGGPQYLGLPYFLIRDGSPSWWESPDIYLTHPNHSWVPPGDLYIPDMMGATPPYNNTINIDTRNIGTHPVRAYSLGIELFKTGAGVTNEQHTVCDKIPSGILLLPIDLTDIGTPADEKDTCQWNIPFYIGVTHECVKAEAKLLCSDVDFSWSVTANDFEGQRNTDEMSIVPPPPQPMPSRNLQGFMEHIYGIKNTFDTPRRFILVFPENFQKYRDVLELKWFAMPAGRKAEVVPFEVVAEPVPHIPIMLKSGEMRDILLRVAIKPKFDFKDGVKLPFNILVEGDWPGNARETAFATHLPAYAPIAGFTVMVRKGSTTLKGIVLDAKKKPVENARVLIHTVDNLQGAVLTTDRSGRYTSMEINPNVYRVSADAGNWRSKEQILVLLGGKEKPVELQLTEEISGGEKRIKVILDKIRIMNDHDPCLKGKGELTFTAVVVPDNDESRKQVTRLPAKGVYEISDMPGENELRLDVAIFDGLVKNRALSISITGKEIDFFDPDDELNRYHRVFAGDPEKWYGQYYPTDEYLDREDVGDWALWYRIVRA